MHAARLSSSWRSGAIEEDRDVGRRGGEILIVPIGSGGIGSQRYEHGLHLTMAVQRSQLLDPDRLMALRVVVSSHYYRETVVLHLLPQRGEFGREQLHDAERSLRVNPGEGDDPALAVRAAQPAEIGGIGKLGRVAVTAGNVQFASRRVAYRPGPGRSLLPGQHGVTLVQLPH